MEDLAFITDDNVMRFLNLIRSNDHMFLIQNTHEKYVKFDNIQFKNGIISAKNFDVLLYFHNLYHPIEHSLLVYDEKQIKINHNNHLQITIDECFSASLFLILFLLL